MSKVVNDQFLCNPSNVKNQFTLKKKNLFEIDRKNFKAKFRDLFILQFIIKLINQLSIELGAILHCKDRESSTSSLQSVFSIWQIS